MAIKGIKDRRWRGDDMPITTQPMPEFPNLKRPPRRRSGGFDTDYSFLNLPRAGSDVGGPIPRPGMDPVDYQSQVDRYAPNDLPNVNLVAPSYQPLTVEESQSVLDSARPFEDSASLGTNQNERFAELGRFFGEKVSGLQNNIDELINTKSQLTKDLEAAFLQQDEMSQQAIEEKIAALDAQRAELVAQLEQSVAEAEAQGVDAVAAAEQVTADQRQEFEGQISGLDQQLQDLEASKQEAIAAGDQQRVQELEAQQQQLTQEREQLVGQMEEQFGGERGELEGQITSLDEQLNKLQIDKDLAIQQGDEQRVQELEALEQQLTQERDQMAAQMEEQFGGERGEFEGQITDLNQQLETLEVSKQEAIAAGDEQRAAELEAQQQELTAQRDDLVAQMEQQFGGEKTEFEGQIATLEDQLDKLAIDKDLAIQAGDEQRVAELETQEQVLIQEKDALVAQMEEQFGGERGAMEAKQAELEGQLQEIQAAQEAAIAERDQAIAEQDNIRAQAADEQVQALEGLKQQLLTEREGIVGGLEEKIGDLQGEINSLTGARDSAIAERDDAIANQDVIRAEAADAQAQALEGQKATLETEYNQTIGDLQGQLDALNTSEVVADDLPAAESIAITPESIIQYIGETGPFAEGMDVNGDGTVDNLDAIWQAQIEGGLRNPDGTPIEQPVVAETPVTGEPPEPELRTDENVVQNLGQDKPPIYYTPEEPVAEVAPQPVFSPPGTVDLSKVNLPENYMDAINDIKKPGAINFGNIGIGMNQGGEASRIQLLLNRLRR